MMFESIYKKGYEAGYNKRECEDHEAQNRRLEDMLKYGKEIGYAKGREDGIHEGYKIGYECGCDDMVTKYGIVEIDEIDGVEE